MHLSSVFFCDKLTAVQLKLMSFDELESMVNNELKILFLKRKKIDSCGKQKKIMFQIVQVILICQPELIVRKQ